MINTNGVFTLHIVYNFDIYLIVAYTIWLSTSNSYSSVWS